MTVFEREQAVVVGAGVAGIAAARVLVAEGARVRLTDAAPRERLGDLEDLERLGVEVRTGGHDPSDLDGATLVITSPGVAPTTDVLRWAHDRGLPVWGEMELGARLARAPVLAVTGTNGKTTTIGMLASCLRAAGLDAVACGNNGRPFPATAREAHDALVVEVSSFQLAEQMSFHPRISVLLNLAPDHLDHHGSFAAYASAKARIFANQSGDDVHVGNRDDPDAAALSSSAPCAVVWSARWASSVVGSWHGSAQTSTSVPSRTTGPAKRRIRRRPRRRPSRSAWSPPRSSRAWPRTSRRRIAARSLPAREACGSWTTRKRRTCTPRSPRSTVCATPC